MAALRRSNPDRPSMRDGGFCKGLERGSRLCKGPSGLVISVRSGLSPAQIGVHTREPPMSEREIGIRTVLMTYFPMFIATLSLCTSIFNGYLNARFLDIIQHNVGRTEYMRTCKEIIDAYFQVKFRASVISAHGAGERGSDNISVTMPADQIDGANAVNKFAALGTYLANLRDEEIRRRYTQLSLELQKIMGDARRTPPGDLNRLFEPGDRLFAAMNDDCVRSAKDAPM
jgi:hypothetical protein